MKYQKLLDVLADENRLFLKGLSPLEGSLFMMLVRGPVRTKTMIFLNLSSLTGTGEKRYSFFFGEVIQPDKAQEYAENLQKAIQLMKQAEARAGVTAKDIIRMKLRFDNTKYCDGK
jgi:hypothetical protein